ASKAGGSAAFPPLFDAIRNGRSALVRVLAASASDVNVPDAVGDTPLMYAALYGDPETVALLLNRGADPNAKSPSHTTALMLGVGSLAKVQLLVDRGADVNARSITGRTPLLIAASRSGSGEVVRYLLAHGANINDKDELSGMRVIPAGAGG